MNPLHFGPSSGDVCDQQSHAVPFPIRLRIDQAACIDHDDMVAGHGEPRRRSDDDRGKSRWSRDAREPRRGDPRRGDPRRERSDERQAPHRGRVDDIVRYNRPRDDGDVGSPVRYRDNARDHFDVAPKKNHGALWVGLRNTAVGIGGIAGLGGGALLGGMGILNLMHNARTSPSMMMILGGAALAIAGIVALKTVFEEH